MYQHPRSLRASASLAMLVVTLLAVSSLHAQVTGDATPGIPFGVGTVNVPIGGASARQLVRTNGFGIEEADGRVFYPAFSNTLLRGLVDAPAGSTLSVSFLFTGNEPLRLTVYTPLPQQVDVVPRAQPARIFNHQLTQWWRQYNAVARQIADANDYPPLVHTYLTSMLGNRLGLRLPLLTRVQESKQPTELQQTLELLVGTEKVRAVLLRQAMESQPAAERAALPVPADVLWSPLPVPTAGVAADIEPIAMRVPEECFYIRFGTFDNYLWLSRLTREYGGDIGRMVTLRGYDARLSEKVQRQLAVHESALSELLGSTVVEDIAIIGRDLYMQDGAAIGLLFHAKNNFTMSTDLEQKRSAALAANKDRGATLETVEVGGRKASFLSTPDNYLRSYYIADGDFHLVTSSREVARRFLETSKSESSLGASAEFQEARRMMPTSREDTIFVYFSSAFFRGLVSPQYHVELQRRLRAATDLQMVQLARLAAMGEGQPADSTDDLVAGGFLRAGFGRNADGSGPILEVDRAIDSLRGARGSFTPIPDVELQAVTGAEASQYVNRAAHYSQKWKQMDPLMIGIKRYALGESEVERVVIDANVSPLAKEKYGWLMSMIGPPTDVRIATPGDELISMQATLRGGLLAPGLVPHHLFLGVRDAPPNANLQPTGLFEILQMMRETLGYLGSWPKLGILDWLPLHLGGSPTDASGFSRLLVGVWRWQSEGFSVLSFQRDVLEHTVAHLHPEPTENPAQIRIHIGDVSRSQLSRWFSFLNYERATQTSMGNAKLLHALSQQLRVARDEALETAEEFLESTLVCSLGGKYELSADPSGAPTWRSTRWPVAGQPFPADYNASLMKWFRGLNLDLTKYGDRMVMHTEIDMQRSPVETAKLKLPLFNLFGGGDAEEKKEDDNPLSE
ncbi:MAG: hypothetical protein CMJ64_20610 [Planctomycetaceae bacterium]|nr:hypothetical protein [Planctomycetaceae bacterium]